MHISFYLCFHVSLLHPTYPQQRTPCYRCTHCVRKYVMLSNSFLPRSRFLIHSTAATYEISSSNCLLFGIIQKFIYVHNPLATILKFQRFVSETKSLVLKLIWQQNLTRVDDINLLIILIYSTWHK